MIEILHRLTKPQKMLENYLRAFTMPNMKSIGHREESLWRGNVSQKMIKKLIFSKISIFMNIEVELKLDQKITVFKQKSTFF